MSTCRSEGCTQRREEAQKHLDGREVVAQARHRGAARVAARRELARDLVPLVLVELFGGFDQLMRLLRARGGACMHASMRACNRSVHACREAGAMRVRMHASREAACKKAPAA